METTEKRERNTASSKRAVSPLCEAKPSLDTLHKHHVS